MLVRVSTRTRAAPGAGRGGTSDLHKTHELDPGIRYHRLLRFDRERAAHGDDRKANQRWQRSPADTEVDSNRSHRRGPITRERNRDRARADDQSAPRQYLPALRAGRMVRGRSEAPLAGGSTRDTVR